MGKNSCHCSGCFDPTIYHFAADPRFNVPEGHCSPGLFSPAHYLICSFCIVPRTFRLFVLRFWRHARRSGNRQYVGRIRKELALWRSPVSSLIHVVVLPSRFGNRIKRNDGERRENDRVRQRQRNANADSKARISSGVILAAEIPRISARDCERASYEKTRITFANSAAR